MQTSQPNILLITSDQQHHSALGVVNPHLRTPNLDQLAREGTRFTRAYCNSPVCSPSRATIITGQYPSSHGCWSIGVKLGEDVPTVGDVFRENGYATTLIGKAHFQPLASRPEQTSLECQPTLRDLEFWRDFNGPWYGFEHIEIARNHADEAHVGQHYALWMEENGLRNWRDYFCKFEDETGKMIPGGRQHKWNLPKECHYSTWTAERSIAAIDRAHEAKKPFFLWASFHDPHPPYLVPEPYDAMYDPTAIPIAYPHDAPILPGEMDDKPPHFGLTQRDRPDFGDYAESGFANHGFHSHLRDPEKLRKDIAVYYGMTTFMDEQIGRILNRLDELGIAENTLVVFSTDHGHFLGQHGLNAKGAFHYEDLLRLPFLVRWPGVVPAGRTSSAIQALIDLPETFLSAANIRVPGQMQGVNQLPVWAGERDSARDWAITEFRHQPTRLHLRTYIEARYKITLYRDRSSWGELFDLETDPEERVNRFHDPEYAAVKSNLLHRFLNAEMVREPTRFDRIAHA